MSGVPLFDDLNSFCGSTLPLSEAEEREEAVKSSFKDTAEAEEEQKSDPGNDTDNNSSNCSRTEPVVTA